MIDLDLAYLGFIDDAVRGGNPETSLDTLPNSSVFPKPSGVHAQ